MKQIEEKKAAAAQVRTKELHDFNTVGNKASNVYYINQDKKDARMASLKGGGRSVAENLRQKQTELVTDKQT